MPKVNSCDTCTKSYGSKYLSQCLKCSKDGRVFICDHCGSDHDHFQENAKDGNSSLKDNQPNLLIHENEQSLQEFSRITNITTKEAKELSTLNKIKLIDKNSREGKVIIEYFTNSLTSKENRRCIVENIWSLNRKVEDKKLKKNQLDTTKTMLLWNSTMNNLYKQDLANLLTIGYQIERGQNKKPRSLSFHDRILSDSPIKANSSDHGVLILSEVCLQDMEFYGVYDRSFTYRYTNTYKYLGQKIPDPCDIKYIDKVKVPVGKTIPSLKTKNEAKWPEINEFNVYYIGDPYRVVIKYLVHFKKCD